MCLALALALTGCGGRTYYEALRELIGAGGAPSSGGAVERADVDYADMDPESWSAEEFRGLIARFDSLTDKGGTDAEFESAELALKDGLYGLYTASALLDNAAYADTADTELSDRANEAWKLYLDAYDAFMLAHRRLAESENADLLRTCFGDDHIAYFRSYEPSRDEENALSDEETALISRYYALAGDTEANAREIGDIFVRLVELRNTQARLAGYASYAELSYGSMYARTYSPEDARGVWQGAREHFAPLVWEATGRVLPSAAALEEDAGLDCSEESVLKALGTMAEKLSPELKAAYDYMVKYHLYDIGDAPGKAQIGYTAFLYAYNEPYLFNAPSGTFYDFADTAHEFGHFTSFFYEPPELIFGLADNDLSELQSQGMAVAMSFLFDDLFGARRGDTMRDCVLLELALSVVDGAMYDEFQQRVFAEEELTPERVDRIFSEVYLSYGYEPYEGYEREWMGVAHNFDTPFYYISYAVSALGALELWERCEEDFDAGLQDYLAVLSMDPELWYYTDALEKAGLSDIFDGSTYENIAGALAGSLGADDAPAA